MTGADLPPAGSLLHVVVDAVDWPARLHSVDGLALTLAPLAVSLLRPPALEPGRPLRLAWAETDAQYELAGRLDRLAPGGLWEVTARPPRTRLQRRAHVRVPVTTEATVGTPHGFFTGMVMDLSEGAVRCRVPRDDHPDPGACAVVDLAVQGEQFTLRGEVVRVAAADNDTVDVVVAFVGAEAASDRLRRHVFALQLRARAVDR